MKASGNVILPYFYRMELNQISVTTGAAKPIEFHTIFPQNRVSIPILAFVSKTFIEEYLLFYKLKTFPSRFTLNFQKVELKIIIALLRLFVMEFWSA